MELLDRRDEWGWLCGHFQDEKYLGGSKFPEIDMFNAVYVWPGDELTEQLHDGNVHRGLRNACLLDLSASSSKQRPKQVDTLTSKVEGLK
ncbi:hypothetical protein C1H46_019891 [Malus baccata]|uniref:Uncharacterized protein n=1 Tax=Malus baccata TaxID=106549 RepID=A0A540M6T7_MALBA|nr:hypothetical protein C1H46_019891 [Malus baccata]